MAIDDKVAFYLQHRPLIEEWAALREQAAIEMEESLVRAVVVVGQRPDTPQFVEEDARRWPTYGLDLRVPGAEPGTVRVALGWTRGELLKLGGAQWPYVGVKVPGATRGETVYDMVRELLRDAALMRQWTQLERGWAWWSYIPLGIGETDLDAYATGHVEDLVTASKALQAKLDEI